ncbi:MAG: hypothetical protein NC817_02165 [Candidatus Omnitrophica bacterium]|nr:hypothetical protein [Candidatus Omnitrophota bacterium]MCM8823685.1 hypothetical protein [Candidatus Omnitrophota bacterium]
MLNLPLIGVETLLKECYKEEDKSGYDVPISVTLHRQKKSFDRNTLS